MAHNDTQTYTKELSSFLSFQWVLLGFCFVFLHEHGFVYKGMETLPVVTPLKKMSIPSIIKYRGGVLWTLPFWQCLWAVQECYGHAMPEASMPHCSLTPSSGSHIPSAPFLPSVLSLAGVTDVLLRLLLLYAIGFRKFCPHFHSTSEI